MRAARLPFWISLLAIASACGRETSPSGSTSGAGGKDASAPLCDQSGDCGDQKSPIAGCVKCAVEGPCLDHVRLCELNPTCITLIECIEACADTDCIDRCNSFHATGRPLLDAWLGCVYCDHCASDCNTDLSECP